MAKRVLVLGATGVLGAPVARALTARGNRVRVLARSPEKARRMLGEEVEVVVGNSTNRDQVAVALVGSEAAHVSLPSEAELAAVRHIVELAASGAAPSLRRISYVSGTSVREENRWFDLIDRKLEAEDLIRRSGLPYTVFCPTWVMEVLPNFVKKHRAVIIRGKRPPALHFFAAADFGRMVARSYEDDRAAGQRFFIHGPDAITLPDALRTFFQGCHPELKVTTLDLWHARLLATLTGQRSTRSAVRLIAYFDKTEEHGNPSDANAALGAPTTTLAEWIRARTDTGPAPPATSVSFA